MTRRRDVEAAEDEALRAARRRASPRWSPWSARPGALHLEKVTKVSPRGEPGDDRATRSPICRDAGKRVIYDAEHFFDGYRDDAGYALECLRAAVDGGRRERHPLRHQRLQPARRRSPRRRAAVVGRARRARSRSGSTPTTTPSAAVANSLAAVEEGARLVQGTINGYGERCGNANLVSILPALQLKMGYECVGRRAARRADRDRALRRRALQHDAGPGPALRRPQRLRPQGRHARRRRRGRRPHLRAHRPGAGRQRARDPRLRALRQGRRSSSRAERAGIDARRRAAARARRAAQGARAPRLPLRGRRRVLRAAAAPGGRRATSRCSGSRASGSSTEKREDGKVETEATIKIWVDGERYLRTAEGNGPVNALDRALRGAIIDRHPHLADIELTNYKVRILDEHHGTGAVTRVLLDSSDGEREWGSIGVSENIIEASWEALVDSLEYAFQPRRTESTAPSERADPARATELGAREEELVLEVLRSGAALAGADARALRARLRRLARGRATRSRSPAAPPRSTSASGRSAGARATRSCTSPFSFVASANCLLYEGVDAGLLRRRPGHAQPRSRRRPRPRSASAPPGILPVHIFGYPAATCRSSSEIAAEQRPRHPRGRLRGARRASTARGARVGTARQPRRPSPSTPTSR